MLTEEKIQKIIQENASQPYSGPLDRDQVVIKTDVFIAGTGPIASVKSPLIIMHNAC